MEAETMNYIYVHKAALQATLKYINWSQTTAGTFYNVRVLPYRGKKYNPETYVTIAIG
jgi:hypothetical protein